MANPGPATTVTAHPSNVSTNQALRLIAVQKGVNLNATGLTAVPVNNTTTYMPKELIVTNVNNAGAAASISTSTALGIVSTQSTSATSLFGAIAPSQLTTVLGTSYVDASSAAIQTALNNQTLYVNVTTAAGTTATGDVYVYGYDFS
jgi:hypothetical protein